MNKKKARELFAKIHDLEFTYFTETYNQNAFNHLIGECTDLIMAATNDWRRVEDELPEIGADVLCCEGDGDMFVSRFTGEIERPMPRHKKRPVFDDPTGYYSPKGEFYVTHWRPLPEPPVV